MEQTHTIYRTIKKSKALIVEQSFEYFEKIPTGKNAGKIKSKRIVQYCKDLDTIFKDEQLKITDNPKITPITIHNGEIRIPNQEIHLLHFFEIHPDNFDSDVKGKKLFKKFDIFEEETYELEKFEIIDSAKDKIRKADKDEIKGAAIQIFGHHYAKLTIGKIIPAFRTRIENDLKFAKQVIAYFDDKNNTEKQIVNLAIINNIIHLEEGKKVVWSDGNEVIFIGSQAKNALDEFCVWVKTNEEGVQHLKIISEKLKTV